MLFGLVIIGFIFISILKIIREIDNIRISNSIKEEIQYISVGLSKYVLDHYSDLTVNRITTIDLKKIENYLQKDFQKFNALGLVPCIYLQYDSYHVIHPFLYYIKINNSFEKKLSYLDFEKIISKIGVAAGFYYKAKDTNSIEFKSVNNNWTPDFDIANLDVNTCNDTHNTASLPDKGVIINLTLDNFFTAVHTKNYTMEMSEDKETNPGSADNKNTFVTNVSLYSKGNNIYPESFHKLYLNAGKNIGLMADKNDPDTLFLNNGNFNADDFIILTNNNSSYAKNIATISQGTLCDSKYLGKLVGQLKDSGTGLIVATQLQCVYSPILCDGGDYCYLPVNENKIKFHPYTTTFECPKGYFISEMPKVDECSFEGRIMVATVRYYSKNKYNLNIAYKADGICLELSSGYVFPTNLTEVICSNSNYTLSYILN